MAVNKYTGKELESTLNEALVDMNLSLDDVVYHSTEKKMGLFKGTQVEVTVIPLVDIQEEVKDYLSKILTIMGLEVTFETMIREKQIKIKMYSDDNPILIGQGGRTLSSLQTVMRSMIKTKYGVTPYISLDVENYKDKQLMYIEKTAKRIAKEVSRTKIPVELDNMNSYERLIVHNAVADFKEVYSESVGEEPNRHVVIKPKNED